jgi:hypothetical protein
MYLLNMSECIRKMIHFIDEFIACFLSQYHKMMIENILNHNDPLIEVVALNYPKHMIILILGSSEQFLTLQVSKLELRCFQFISQNSHFIIVRFPSIDIIIFSKL